MKIVKEALNFERGLDPLSSMGIGTVTKIKKDLEEVGYPIDKIKINDDLTIEKIPGHGYYSASREFRDLISIKLKYLPEKLKPIAEKIMDSNKEPISEIIKDAKKAGITKEQLEYLTGDFLDWAILDNKRSKNSPTQVRIALAENFKNKETEEFDEEYNTYAFIGFRDKTPVTINGKKYYEDQFQAETMIKIDRYDIGSLSQIHPMKIRARAQYPDGRVYIVDIPKFMMDEDKYNGIPEQWRDIIEKYKRTI
jgi:hypothetical protein